MAEKLYTIPVNEVFEKKCECPVCEIYHNLEKCSLEFTMGPSYMEDDIRAMTDKTGFCKIHSEKLLSMNNRLGMALILKTHTDKVNKDIEKLASNSKVKGLFKKADNKELLDYIRELNSSCFVCNRINEVFDRYIATIFHLWKHDSSFKEKYLNSQGFCVEHFGLLMEKAESELSGKAKEEFLLATIRIYNENMTRINEELAWFINKFDYKYKDEPWKNSKDSVPRALTKLNGIVVEEQ
ncbi:MAG: hypothetical protein IIX45_04455 [Lachnospiraceae bacterium]|nr:hypothetical protein [Lachnospiraceae bacterium]